MIIQQKKKRPLMLRSNNHMKKSEIVDSCVYFSYATYTFTPVEPFFVIKCDFP